MSRRFRLRTEGQVNTKQLISVSMNRQRSSVISVIKQKLLGLARVHAHATLSVSDEFCKIKRSWRFEQRCTEVLFETTLVMAVYAPDSSKGMGLYKTFHLERPWSTTGRTSWWSQRLLHELGMMCTDEEDIEQFKEMYGPLCWQGYDHDPAVFKKLMWDATVL